MRSLYLLPLIVAVAACERGTDVTGPRGTEGVVAGALGPLSVTIGPTVPPPGLVACWAAEGDATDGVGENDGTLSPIGVSYAEGRFGQAFSFDALGGDVVVPWSASLNVGQGSGLTFSAWIFPEGKLFGNALGPGPILEFENGAAFWAHYYQPDWLWDPDSALFASLAINGNPDLILQVTRVLTLNAWNQVAVTYSSETGNMALFVNGRTVASRNSGSFAAGTLTPLHIGSRPPGSFGDERYTFNGLIDEVQIYGRDLTQAEVAQLGSAQGSMCGLPPTAATHLGILAQPASAVSGVVFSPQPAVEVLDASGARVTTASGTVTVSRGSGTGALQGTLVANVVNGVAAFSGLKIAGSGPHSLSFASTGLTGVSSSTFVVTQVAQQIAIIVQPGNAGSNDVIAPSPVVELRDAAGLRVLTANNAVTVSIATGSGLLAGTTTISAVNGRVTFNGLRIFGAGTLTLRFSSLGMASVTSASFTAFLSRPYSWQGFFNPIDNPPAMNKVNSGQTIPIKFSLGRNDDRDHDRNDDRDHDRNDDRDHDRNDGRDHDGNTGDGDILALDSPASRQVSCANLSSIGPLQPISAGKDHSLEYDSKDGRYTIQWKTDKSWRGTCRTLVLILRDGTVHQAHFNFSK